MGRTLLCIDTPYNLLPFGSIFYHLGKLVQALKKLIYTAENCHSPSYTATNDARERAQDHTAYLNSAIRA